MFLLLIILGLAVVFLLYGVSIYNKLVRLKNLVKEAWSSIDVMLKKRHDLIPNIVETVKGYATHEKETLQSVIDARNQATGRGSVKDVEAAEAQLSSALTRLFALAEQYPDLKANTNFLQFCIFVLRFFDFYDISQHGNDHYPKRNPAHCLAFPEKIDH